MHTVKTTGTNLGRRATACLAVAALAGLNASDAQAQAAIETVALTGVSGSDPRGPGLGAGVTYASLQTLPFVDSTNRIAFAADLTGAGVTPANGRAMFLGAAGEVSAFRRLGDAAPGLPTGVTLASSLAIAAFNANNIAYTAQLAGQGVSPAVNDFALFAGPYASPTVIRSGDPATGIPGATYGALRHTSPVPFNAGLTPGGKLTLVAGLVGQGIDAPAANALSTNNNHAAFVGTPASPQLFARTGPGNGPNLGGNQYYVYPNIPIRQSDSAVPHGLLTTAVDDNDEETIDVMTTGLYTFVGGVGTIVASRNMPAPGIPGATLTSFAPTIGADLKLGFFSLLSGDAASGVNDTNDRVLVHGQPGALSVIARTGAPAVSPTLPANATFFDFGNSTSTGIAVNNVGGVGFVATVQGMGVTLDNNTSFWVGPADAPRLVAREGDAVIDITGGPVLDKFQAGGAGFAYAINDNGLAVFRAGLRGAGVLAGVNDNGLFGVAGDGSIIPIALEGGLFDVDPDPLLADLRTVANNGIGFDGSRSNMEDGRMIFNNDNLLTFNLQFTDGSSGIFTAVIPVPEPGCLSALLAGAGLLALRRRK